MEFQRNGETFGRMFSLMPSLASLFPNQSGFKYTREASMALYNYFKVITNNLHLQNLVHTLVKSNDRL